MERNTDLLLEPNQFNRLKKTSLIRANKIATLDKGLILGKIGEMQKQSLLELDQKLREVFGLK